MARAGWPYRRYRASLRKQRDLVVGAEKPVANSQDPFAAASGAEEQGRDFDPATETHEGIVLGIGTCSYRGPDGTDHFVALPGDDVRVGFPKASMPPEAISETYTIVDIYESKMSEYDSKFVFVPLRASCRNCRGMVDPDHRRKHASFRRSKSSCATSR